MIEAGTFLQELEDAVAPGLARYAAFGCLACDRSIDSGPLH